MTGGTTYWQGQTSSTTNGSTHSNYHADSTSGSGYGCCRYRWILVSAPVHWDKIDSLAFVDLINNKTKTGCTVTMVIDGEILITDPDIETRTMEEFLPLLKKLASSDDIKTINDFFSEHALR